MIAVKDLTMRQYSYLLACALKNIGLGGDLATAAAIIHQIDYWIEFNKNNESTKPDNERKHYRSSKWWVYNTMAQWQKEFPYAAQKTIERTFRKLEKCGIVETGRYNQKGYDRTKWYTLNYELIENLMQKERDKLSLSNSRNMAISKGTNSPHTCGQFDVYNTKEYSNINTNITQMPEHRKNYSRKNVFKAIQSGYQSDWDELEKQLIDN